MHFQFDDTYDDSSISKTSTFGVIRKIYPFLKPHKKSFAIATVLLFLAVAGELAGPLILRMVIDTAIPDKSVRDIVFYSLLFAGTFSFAMVMSYLQVMITTKVGLSVVRDLKEKVFRHMLSLSLSFFDRNPTGKLMARVDRELPRGASRGA